MSDAGRLRVRGMVFSLLSLGCLLGAMSLSRWDVARFWLLITFEAAVWAWAGYWLLKVRRT